MCRGRYRTNILAEGKRCVIDARNDVPDSICNFSARIDDYDAPQGGRTTGGA